MEWFDSLRTGTFHPWNAIKSDVVRQSSEGRLFIGHGNCSDFVRFPDAYTATVIPAKGDLCITHRAGRPWHETPMLPNLNLTPLDTGPVSGYGASSSPV